jgi:hypothetical protein
MPCKKHTPEEVIGKLREAEIVLAQAETTVDVCHRLSIILIIAGARSMEA